MKGIQIRKKDANNVRKVLLSSNQLCKKVKVRNDEKYVYLPLIENYDESIVKNLEEEYEFILDDYTFIDADYRPTNFMDFLEDKISDDKIDDIVKSFDTVGDIVILEIPPELEENKKIIGQAVLKFTKRKSVYYKKSKVEGITRTRRLEFLAGVDSLETIHKEFGLRFKLNPSTVYFSPRLATERSRIVEQVNDGEVIIDFFAGIGSFPISIASKRNVTAYNVDINPEAYKYVNENIKLNKLTGTVIPVLGDINDVIKDLPMADRIIMNLPGTSRDFLPLAVNHLNSGGVLNYYEFSSNVDDVIEHVRQVCGNWDLEVMNTRKVRSQSPGIWHYGVDIKIFK